MSKLQKALQKIQAASNRQGRASGADIDANDSMIIARLSSHAVDTRLQVAVGRCLEVDRSALRKAGLIAPEQDEQLLGNQYRDIKRPLIAHAFGKRATRVEAGNLIMVSSALSGDGKTFTSINLALSMAQERDHTVLLVDADVAKPHVSEMFGAQDEPGLLDILDGSSALAESLILPTDVDRLSILPAGKPQPNANELLSSEAMERFMRDLSSRSEGQIVIFDTPPLLQTSEAKVLADLAGQIVLVVCAEVTAQGAVLAALESIHEDKAVNLLLNQVRSGFGDNPYGSGRGYGYGKTFSEDHRDSIANIFD